LFLLLVVDRGDLSAHRDKFVLRLFPVALGDERLHLVEFGFGGQPDLVVAHLLLRPHQHGVQSVQRVTGSGSDHDGTESADAQHRGGGRADDAQTTAMTHRAGALLGVSPPLRVQSGPLLGAAGIERRRHIGFTEQTCRGRPTQFVAPIAQQRRQFGIDGVLRNHRTATGQRVDEPVGATDLFQ
jgi:hypothetical protein